MQHSLTAGTPLHGTRMTICQWAVVFWLSLDPTVGYRWPGQAGGGKWQHVLKHAQKLEVSERQLRRWLTKLDCRRHTQNDRFIRAFKRELGLW
jgi:hypothetical protein